MAFLSSLFLFLRNLFLQTGIVVDTDNQTVEESKNIVLKALNDMGYLPNYH